MLCNDLTQASGLVEGKHQRHAICAGRKVDAGRHLVLIFQQQILIAQACDGLSLLISDADGKEQQIGVDADYFVFILGEGRDWRGCDKKTDE